jgi:hypothetical protein
MNHKHAMINATSSLNIELADSEGIVMQVNGYNTGSYISWVGDF